jgi:hypothetical protein
MQLLPLKNFNIKTCFIQFLWFFRLKCWFIGQIISRIHLSLPNAYKLMCFDRNINGNRDVKFFEWDYWSLHWRKNLTLGHMISSVPCNDSSKALENWLWEFIAVLDSCQFGCKVSIRSENFLTYLTLLWEKLL